MVRLIRCTDWVATLATKSLAVSQRRLRCVPVVVAVISDW